jgi:hypothetical protein
LRHAESNARSSTTKRQPPIKGRARLWKARDVKEAFAQVLEFRAMFRIQALDRIGTGSWRDIAYIWESEFGQDWAFSERPADFHEAEEAIDVASELRAKTFRSFRVVECRAGEGGSDKSIWPPTGEAEYR